MFVCFSFPPMTHGCRGQTLACRSSSRRPSAIPGHLLGSRSMPSAPLSMPARCMAAKTPWQRVLEMRQTSWVWWLWTRILLMPGWNYCPLRTKQKVFVFSPTRAWTSPALKQVRCVRGGVFSGPETQKGSLWSGVWCLFTFVWGVARHDYVRWKTGDPPPN